ncbi:MAG: c-type cytochrome [Pirellulales bacterium]|nr:c-type cytochrome [Pirellulales bacterium]
MPRLPAVEPAAALETIETEPGFRLELAAAEPDVADPVAMDFDEYGKLFVVEMLGYSEDADDMLGRIRLLEDADRDGRFEKSTVYADGLAWPTAAICYDGGVFVGAAPEILYFKDDDRDGRADQRRTVFTGFGASNVQGLLNSFRWGVDNRIHVAVSSCGAELRRADQPDAEPLVLRGRNFAFDPRTLAFEATSGASQHGMCFDSWGNQFTCSNSDHIQQVLVEQHYLARNPLLQPPAILKSIAVEGPAADVYRISPVEPWREIRTRLRAKGIVPGIVEGGGRAAGYFTSATGVTIYTGDAWPQEYRGNAFIGDVGSNLVHRKVIERDPAAIPLTARRATPQREFLASRDTWFRPVQFANGPDGNLYILDMYREVIEHPASLPPVLKKHLDLTSGRDRGRIYRVETAAATAAQRRGMFTRAMPAAATGAELVRMLAHPNGWHRTTAARLLYERRDAELAEPLKQLAASGSSAEAKILALYALASLDELQEGLLVTAMADAAAEVRRHAVRLAGERLTDRQGGQQRSVLAEAVLKSAQDDDLRVRYQAALVLGDYPGDERLAALAEIARRDAHEPYLAAAVLSSLNQGGEQVLSELLSDREFADTAHGRAFLGELARQIGVRGDERELQAVSRRITGEGSSDPGVAEAVIRAVLSGAGANQVAVRAAMASASGAQTEKIAARLFHVATGRAVDEKLALNDRLRAIDLLPLGTFEEAAPMLTDLLAARQPPEIQAAALAAMGQFGRAELAEPVLESLPGMSPSLRMQAAELLISRSDTAGRLLAAVGDGRLSPRDLDPSTIQKLKTHPDLTVSAEARRLLDSAAPRRADVVEAHRDALELTGNAERGCELFRKNCAICHRRDGFGTEVGADLATVVTRTPEALLISILDPNREVDPKYMQYSVLTVDGLAKSGIIAAETAASVTLRREENATETIPRADIEELRSTGMTLMPEGFEKVLDRQALADLIAYLRSDPASK